MLRSRGGTITVILAALAMAFAGSPAFAHTTRPRAHAAPAARVAVPRVDVGGTNDWCENQSGLCLRDPSDGGTGTSVLASTDTNSNAEDWQLVRDTGRCANALVTSSCPGGWVSSAFRGFTLVVLKNVGQGTLCIRTPASNGYTAVMGACDENPGPEISSAFVWAQFSSGIYGFDSVAASNAFSTQEWLTGGTTNNSTVFDKPGGATGNGEWFALGS